MKPSVVKPLVTLLSVVTIGLQAPLASAAMVSTEDAATSAQIQADREKVKAFLDRASVQDRLHTLGVQVAMAKDRVDALTDSEVSDMARKIDQLPAGGDLSRTDWILILLVAILVVVAA